MPVYFFANRDFLGYNSVKRTSNHSEQRLFREEVLSFTSHIYMTLAILCRRRHKVAIIAELNLKFSSRFLRQRNACGMEISVMNQKWDREPAKAGISCPCFFDAYILSKTGICSRGASAIISLPPSNI